MIINFLYLNVFMINTALYLTLVWFFNYYFFFQVEKKKLEEKKHRDMQNDQLLDLIEKQRLYFKTVKDFKEVIFFLFILMLLSQLLFFWMRYNMHHYKNIFIFRCFILMICVLLNRYFKIFFFLSSFKFILNIQILFYTSFFYYYIYN